MISIRQDAHTILDDSTVPVNTPIMRGNASNVTENASRAPISRTGGPRDLAGEGNGRDGAGGSGPHVAQPIAPSDRAVDLTGDDEQDEADGTPPGKLYHPRRHRQS